MAGGPVATWRRNTSPSCSRLSRAAFMPASPGGLPLCAFLDSVPGSVSVTHSRWPMFPDAGIGRGPAHRWGRELRACDSHPLPSASPVTLGKLLFLPVPRFSYLCNEGPFQGLPQHSHRQHVSEEPRRAPPRPCRPAVAVREVLAIVRNHLASRTLSSLCLIFHTSVQIISFLEEYESLGELPYHPSRMRRDLQMGCFGRARAQASQAT